MVSAPFHWQSLRRCPHMVKEELYLPIPLVIIFFVIHIYHQYYRTCGSQILVIYFDSYCTLKIKAIWWFHQRYCHFWRFCVYIFTVYVFLLSIFANPDEWSLGRPKTSCEIWIWHFWWIMSIWLGLCKCWWLSYTTNFSNFSTIQSPLDWAKK